MKTYFQLFVFFILFALQSLFGQNWNAVCVGINDYPGTYNDLNWCISDAQAIKYYLEAYKQWSSGRINLLTDGNANESAIHSAIANMSRTAGNTNFFHYSGHGDSQELGGSNGIIPSNSLDARVTPSELQADFGSTYNQSTAFIDACGTGIFPRDMSIGVISSGCKADEYSYESSSIQHGYFTYYLLAGLTQSTINTAEQLHNYAAPLVTQAQSDQHPQLGDRFAGYLSIYNATYTLSGTLSRFETWSAASTMQGNVYVPSGITLTIASNMNLTLNGYSIISSGGTIMVQSGATINGLKAYLQTGGSTVGYCPSIQSAVNNAPSGSNWIVQLLSTTYNESPSFSSKSNLTMFGNGQGSTVLNGGVSFTNSSNIQIRDLTTSYPFVFNYSSGITVWNATVTGSTLANNYSSTSAALGFVTANNIGASFGLNTYGGTGDLYYASVSNGDCAAYLTNNASYNIGTNNTFCCNGLDIYAGNGGYAYAISNTYSRPLPQTIYGNVFVTGQNGVCGQQCEYFAKAAKNNSIALSTNTSEFSLQTSDDKYLALLRKIKGDKDANQYDAKSIAREHQQLIDEYKSYVKDGNDKRVIKAAMSKISHLYKGMEDKNGFYSYLAEALASGKLKSVESYFKRYFIWKSVDENNYSNALKIADQVLASASDDNDLVCEMMYEKGLVYKYYLNDADAASAQFSMLLEKYPGHPLNSFAASEVNTMQKEFSQDSTTKNETVTIESYNLVSSPNPFNPTTNISFTLPEASLVRLAVYDILGREVAQLVNEMKGKGKHTVIFNGNNLASGIYLCRLEVGKDVAIKKLLLTK